MCYLDQIWWTTTTLLRIREEILTNRFYNSLGLLSCPSNHPPFIPSQPWSSKLLVLYLGTCYTLSHSVWFYLIQPGITAICNVLIKPLVTQRARDRSRQIRWRVARWLCVASNKRRDFFSSFLFSFFYLDPRFTRPLGNLLNRSWTRSTNDKTKNIPSCFLRSPTQFLLRYILVMLLCQASNWKILS